jgi:hypothetical protein
MTKNIDTLSTIEYENFLLEPHTLLITDEETHIDISNWEKLYNKLFVIQSNLFTLEQKTFLIGFQLNKIIESDKINNTNIFNLFYTKHKNLIKKIIENTLEIENSLEI